MIPPVGQAWQSNFGAAYYRLGSLWEMLEKHASLFSEATGLLCETKWICVQTARSGADNPVSRLQIAAVGRHAIDTLKRACILADMDDILPEIERLSGAFEMLLSTPEFTIDTVCQSIKHLISRIHDELKGEWFFHLDQRDVEIYLEKSPFGSQVSDKFPLAAEDIAEAAKCLALQRSTASVFHLMRAMEVVVRRLGKRLGVKNVEKEWGKILSDIDQEIKEMPTDTTKKKNRKNAWSQARANLYHVKQAWRNETMHPKSTYTREQALEVFNATRVFMGHLAGLI